MATNYRKFGRKDLDAAVELSREAGWPHRLEDWALAHRLGRGYIAEERGEVVGTVLAWNHDGRSASLGMVIVAGSHRGQGIGRRLMKLALRDAGGRSVMLNATPSGQPLYAKLGFRRVGDIEQHQGIVSRIPVESLAAGERLRPVGASDEPDLVALATRAAGSDRGRVVAHLLKEGQAIVLARQGRPLGFAMCRRFGRGRVIGPVVASDAGRARALIGHWVATFPGKFLRIDVPVSAGLGRWLDGIGLKCVDIAVTMVKGVPPAGETDLRIFALANQALG